MLSLIHVIEWRARATPDHVALSDHRGGQLTYVLAWARERMAAFKCPTGVSTAAELPRNATGKVLKSVLREPYWAGRDRQVS